MAASVYLDQIDKFYGQKQTLKNISLAVEAGEFVSLVGPSGCGKSTLLRVVAGLTRHDAGALHIDDENVGDALPRDRDVAMVFQSYALYPHMTVAENIATPLRMQHLSGVSRLPLLGKLWPGSRKTRKFIQSEVEEVAAQVQLEHLLQSRPSELSGGQRQRVAVARAMVRQPGVFLMDEPLSNLDTRLRVHMRAEISALHKRVGSTFIYVTHDQVEAMTLSDRVAVMMEGEIVQVGTPRELFEEPKDIRVAQFIGSPEINLFDAKTDSEGRVWLGSQSAPLTLSLTDEPIKLAWRPEHLKLVKSGPLQNHSSIRISTHLERSEMLGHDVLLFCKHLPSNTILTVKTTLAEVDALRSKGVWSENITLEGDINHSLCFDKHGKRVVHLASNESILRSRMVN